MVASAGPHAYAQQLVAVGDGRSPALAVEVSKIIHSCRSAGVSPIFTLHHFCAITGIPHKVARSAFLEPEKSYKTHKINKRNGAGLREINVPSHELRVLQDFAYRLCLPQQMSSPISYAYESNRSTYMAAEQHVGARSVIRLDILDFFGSIQIDSIYDIYDTLGYAELFSFELALISTIGDSASLRPDDMGGLLYRLNGSRHLPQGSPTSGRLANLYCRALDADLSTYIFALGGSLTRYADDIVVSFAQPKPRGELKEILSGLASIIEEHRLQLNRTKTRLFPNIREFRMLGLTVSESTVRLIPRYKRMLLSHIRSIEKFGLSEHAAHLAYDSDLSLAEFLWGHFAYAHGIEPEFARAFANSLMRNNIPRI